jgi:hypothetical protein
MLPIVAATVLLAASASTPARPERVLHERARTRSVLIILALDGEHGRVLSARTVNRPPAPRIPRSHAWEVRVEDRDGRVLYRAPTPPGGVVRSELAGPDGKLTPVTAPDAHAAITVRVPLLPGAATLRVVAPATARAREREIARVAWPVVSP